MSEKFSDKMDLGRRVAGLREEQVEDTLPAEDEDLILESDGERAAFSMVSADRRLKQMLAFCFINGNAKALAYSYLIGIDFDPSSGIRMDFSGYIAKIEGRNLHPLFDGLVAQRVASIRETDALEAEVTAEHKAVVVTRIDIEKAD